MGNEGRPFRFENAWTRHDRYKQVVAEAWQVDTNNLQGIYDALGGVSDRLKSWSSSEFCSVKKQLKTLRARWEIIRAALLRSGPSSEEKELMAKISELLSHEEALEKQMSRALWLAEGDRNTIFFQAKAKERARTYKIKTLKKSDGSIAAAELQEKVWEGRPKGTETTLLNIVGWATNLEGNH